MCSTVDWNCFFLSDSGCCVTKIKPHDTLKLILWGKLTFDERILVPRVVKFRISGQG